MAEQFMGDQNSLLPYEGAISEDQIASDDHCCSGMWKQQVLHDFQSQNWKCNWQFWLHNSVKLLFAWDHSIPSIVKLYMVSECPVWFPLDHRSFDPREQHWSGRELACSEQRGFVPHWHLSPKDSWPGCGPYRAPRPWWRYIFIGPGLTQIALSRHWLWAASWVWATRKFEPLVCQEGTRARMVPRARHPRRSESRSQRSIKTLNKEDLHIVQAVLRGPTRECASCWKSSPKWL